MDKRKGTIQVNELPNLIGDLQVMRLRGRVDIYRQHGGVNYGGKLHTLNNITLLLYTQTHTPF